MTLWTLVEASRVASGGGGGGACARPASTANTPRLSLTGPLLQGALLVANGLAIINNERFLEKCEPCCKGELLLLLLTRPTARRCCAGGRSPPVRLPSVPR